MKQIQPEDLNKNVFDMIGNQWMLITAEKNGVVNTMTASWGGMGILWNRKVAYIFIRPQRYTKEFVDESDTLSLTFFDKSYKSELKYLGTVSGKDENKIEKAGLHIVHEANTPYFEEAELTFICKKLYHQELKEEFFIDKQLNDQTYPFKDYHTMYVVEIEKILMKE